MTPQQYSHPCLKYTTHRHCTDSAAAGTSLPWLARNAWPSIRPCCASPCCSAPACARPHLQARLYSCLLLLAHLQAAHAAAAAAAVLAGFHAGRGRAEPKHTTLCVLAVRLCQCKVAVLHNVLNRIWIASPVPCFSGCCCCSPASLLPRGGSQAAPPPQGPAGGWHCSKGQGLQDNNSLPTDHEQCAAAGACITQQ
jgi:hypothetical protein